MGFLECRFCDGGKQSKLPGGSRSRFFLRPTGSVFQMIHTWFSREKSASFEAARGVFWGMICEMIVISDSGVSSNAL